jgi:hypothetical protein
MPKISERDLAWYIFVDVNVIELTQLCAFVECEDVYHLRFRPDSYRVRGAAATRADAKNLVPSNFLG